MDNAEGNTSESEDLLLAAGVVVGALLLIMAAFAFIIFTFLIIYRRRLIRTKNLTNPTSETENIQLVEVTQDQRVLPEVTEEGNQTSVLNQHYEEPSSALSTKPRITDYESKVQAYEWEDVTLRVTFTGNPKPTITWTSDQEDGTLDDDYAIELNSDGSLLIVCAEQRHAGRYFFELSNSCGSTNGSITLNVISSKERRVHGDKLSVINHLESNPVKEDKFGEHVAQLHSSNNLAFVTDFKLLASGEDGKQVSISSSTDNMTLNRFRNIITYDENLIPLIPDPTSSPFDDQHDYINASYINGYSKPKEYIATQGPLLITVADFWQLVWQEQVKIIAMVTNIKEHGTKKCEAYWPEGGGKSWFGNIQVTLEEERIYADYVIRTLQIHQTKNEEFTRKLTQYHFTSWPDQGVPEYAGPILNYLRRIKAQQATDKGPILVHCSAGVGRTGTLIAIDIALAQASKERQVDIPKIIVDMRKQRMKMVQTLDQYALIYDAVLETIICGDTQIQPSNLRTAVNRLSKKNKVGFAGKSGFEKQFEVLDQVSHKPSEVNRQLALLHSTSNRSNNFLPPDEWRVVFKGDIHSYINASFANGYKQKKGFIIAQSPMENTVRDFVKMIYERECGVVVMLCGCEEGGVEVCAQYWPTSSETTITHGDFLVSLVSTDKEDVITRRVFTITDPKSNHVQKVTQFQVEQWSREGLCSRPQALIDVIDQMSSIQRNTGNKPIVVHGSDTVSRVGVFCSLVNAIEMCKTEGVVDVFQVVKALRIQKPGAVLTVEQYCFIFELVKLFLDSFSIYSNFK